MTRMLHVYTYYILNHIWYVFIGLLFTKGIPMGYMVDTPSNQIFSIYQDKIQGISS